MPDEEYIPASPEEAYGGPAPDPRAAADYIPASPEEAYGPPVAVMSMIPGMPSSHKTTDLRERPSVLTPEYWKHIPEAAKEDLSNITHGMANLPAVAPKFAWDYIASGMPGPLNPAGLFAEGYEKTPFAQDVKPMAEQLAEEIPHPGHWSAPVDAFYDRPLSTALDYSAMASGLKPLTAPIERAAGLGVRKFASAALGPSQEAIAARFANPEIANAASWSELAYKMPKTLNLLKDKISTASGIAASTLRDSTDISEGAIPISRIDDLANKLISEIQTSGVAVGPARQAAVKQLQGVAGDVQKIIANNGSNAALSERSVKDIIQAVESNINWEDKGLSESNAALTNMRGKLDSLLKQGNPDYAKAMQPVSKMLTTFEDTVHEFNIKSKTGQGLKPTDTTASKLQTVLNEKKSVSQNILKELKSWTGEDYLKQSKDYSYAKQFQGGFAQGSRRTLAGTVMGNAVGWVTGHPVLGNVMGALTGALADRYGGEMAGALTDFSSRTARSLSSILGPEQTQKFMAGMISELQDEKNQGGP